MREPHVGKGRVDRHRDLPAGGRVEGLQRSRLLATRDELAGRRPPRGTLPVAARLASLVTATVTSCRTPGAYP